MSDHFVEMFPWEGPKRPKKRPDNPGSASGKRAKVSKRDFSKRRVFKNEGDLEYNSHRYTTVGAFTRGAPGRRLGIPDGMTAAQAKPLREAALKQAKEDIKLIMKLIPDLDELSQEALLKTAEIMRLPGDTDRALKASRQILDFCMAKPVSRQAVMHDTAESLLARLAAEDAATMTISHDEEDGNED